MIPIAAWLIVNGVFCLLAAYSAKDTGPRIVGAIWALLHVASAIYLWKV